MSACLCPIAWVTYQQAARKRHQDHLTPDKENAGRCIFESSRVTRINYE
uniref:Squamous cell carcinoma antigen recognized by T-cells n=1 Tax=Rhizophora mucronata TaxID=61149 RepID=A0A2P2M5P6_RHIMU